MKLTRYEPFRPLRLFDELDHWDNFFDGFLPKATTISPAIDVEEKGGTYVVTADMPGLNKSEIDISFSDNTLTITAEKKKEDKEEGKRYLRQERCYSKFVKSIPFYEEVNEDEITAAYNDGVLALTLPKKETPKIDTKKIEIN